MTAENPKRRLNFSDSPPPAPAGKRRALFEAFYCGFAVLDGRYSRSMLPWIVSEIAQVRPNDDKVILRLTPVGLRIVQQEMEKDLIEHKFANISRFFRCKPDCIAYLLRTSNTAPLTVHVFRVAGEASVEELLSCLQLAAKASGHDKTPDPEEANKNPTERLPADAFSSYSHFEVLYIGRVELSDRKPASTIIDDAVRKFSLYKTCTLRTASLQKRVLEEKDETEETEEEEERTVDIVPDTHKLDTSDDCSLIDNVFSSPPDCSIDSAPQQTTPPVQQTSVYSSRVMLFLVGAADVRLICLGNKQTLLAKRLSEVCRVMKGASHRDHLGFLCSTSTCDHFVCYVLKCRDESIVDTIMHAMRGAFSAALNEQTESTSPNAFMLRHCCPLCPMEQYAKLCSDLEGLSAPQVHETVLQRIGNLNPEQQEKLLTEYKKLCNSGRSLADIPEELPSAHQQLSSVGFHRRNVVLMSLIRSMCESAQKQHELSTERDEWPVNLCGARRRSLSGTDVTHKLLELGGRAKRSFSVSLDTFGRKLSVGEEAINAAIKTSSSLTSSLISESPEHKSSSAATSPNCSPVPGKPRYNFSTPTSDAGGVSRPRARTYDGMDRERSRSSSGDDGGGSQEKSRSPKPKIFSKFADGGLQTPLAAFRNSVDFSSPGFASPKRVARNVLSTPGRRMSWRLNIFNRVVISPLSKNGSRGSLASVTSGIGLPSSSQCDTTSRRSSAESSQPSEAGGSQTEDKQIFYRSLWKKAIMQQILDNRLNAQKRLKEEESVALKRLKLDYDEITPCSEEEVRPIWNAMLQHPNRKTTRFDRVELEEAVKAGIPRDLRASVWRFLMEQHELDRSKRAQLGKAPPYKFGDLVKDLTPHQHAILIDLGRTFPSHAYFAEQLGAGQLCLFNILKAYSLYDTEVGYCQGLSFIAGALLLHMEEQDAFGMFVELMYRLGLRKQYRPDMMALQIHMYQLSRLVHDRHKDLHQHLEDHEIPTLYAAPWFLTLFASTFPLGFVSRVFDFIFLSGGLDVMFKIALVLLGEHKELIKHCDSFEAINDFLKSTLPSMSIIQMERVFNQVFDLELGRDLLSYEVEYHVLQEEMLASPQPGFGQNNANAATPSNATDGAEQMTKLEEDNRSLKRQNMDLLEKLQFSNQHLKQSEKSRGELETQLQSAQNTIASYDCKISTLESRIAALELERKSLLMSMDRFKNGRVSSVDSSLTNGTVDGHDSGLFETPASQNKLK